MGYSNKIHRFIKFLGSDQPTSSIDKNRWRRWVRWLNKEVEAGRMELTTARVNYGRARVFVRSLIEKQLTQQIAELDASGTEAIPARASRTQLQIAKQSAAALSIDQPQGKVVGS